MKKIKHPTEILTEAEAIVISSSIIFALSIIIFCFKHFYFCAIFSSPELAQGELSGYRDVRHPSYVWTSVTSETSVRQLFSLCTL